MMLPKRIDKREMRGKPRIRSTAHRDFVRGHHCCVKGCMEMPIEVAHINRSSLRGVGEKASDAATVALCRGHHSESHRGERTFESRYGLDLMQLAKEFYRASPHKAKLDDPWKDGE